MKALLLTSFIRTVRINLNLHYSASRQNIIGELLEQMETYRHNGLGTARSGYLAVWINHKGYKKCII